MIFRRVHSFTRESITIRLKGYFSTKLPLNINLFRDEENRIQIKDSIHKRFRDPLLVDKIATLDKDIRTLRYQLQQHRKEINRLSKSFNQQHKAELEQQQKLRDTVQKKKVQEKELTQELAKQQNNLSQMVQSVGNMVHKDAPVHQNEDNNRIVHTVGTLTKHDHCLPYWTVLERLDAVDMKRGQKIAGHRGYFLKGVGVKLAKALTNLSLNFLQQQGYTLYETPLLIKGEMMRQCCQLSDLQKEMYKIEGEDSVLIATSEQSLACMYRQQILEHLPIKMAGFSTCFRKEAGAHGKDNQGLFRVHQFEKAEQFVICREQSSEHQLERMLQTSMKFYRELNIPYQVIEIVSGALNDAASRKFDLQAWFPHPKKYRQLVSVSNCTDYQSRMLEIKYRDKNQNKYVHMLNGTLCAIQRTLCCIVENFSCQEGVLLPQPLAKYYGDSLIKYVK